MQNAKCLFNANNYELCIVNYALKLLAYNKVDITALLGATQAFNLIKAITIVKAQHTKHRQKHTYTHTRRTFNIKRVEIANFIIRIAAL